VGSIGTARKALVYEELAAVREVVDLSPQDALDSAELFVARLGYVTLRRTDTSLWVARDQAHRSSGDVVLALTVVALPQAEGGVRVKVRGNDPEGVREHQAEWSEWVDSLPKRELEEPDIEAAPIDEPEDSNSTGYPEEEMPDALDTLVEEPGVGEPIPHDEVHDSPDIAESEPEQASLPAPYEYKMVELSPVLAVPTQGQGQDDDEAARYLQSLVNEQAEQGWEFYRVDALGVAERSGLLAKLFGHKLQHHYVATFRRPK
jgi:hypothetical protein